MKKPITHFGLGYFLEEFMDFEPHGDKFIGKCPIHEEKTPSFILDPADHRYDCLGCGVRGNNPYEFIMQYHGCGENAATEWVRVWLSKNSWADIN